MSRRRLVILTVLGAAVALPILIGASCPPPSNPFFLSLTTNRLNVGTDIPDCVQGFVCISIVNTACVDAEISLYVHDGYDLDYQYCTYVQWVLGSCLGADVGEFQLAPAQLFTTSNSYSIQGQGIRLLKQRESVLVRIQDSMVKSFGIKMARVGGLPDNAEIIGGPKYRCTMVDPGGDQPRQEDVPTGETFQFVIRDQNECALPGLTQFATTTGTSAPGGCPPISVMP